MGLRTGNKVVRGGRTAVKHGSFLFRMADKISDSFRAFRSAKGLRRVAQVDKAVDFARMADVSHVAGKSASQIARLGDLNALARAGEVSDVAAAGWGLQRFKKGKGAVQKWVAGLLGTDVPDVMRTIDRMDEGIISAQKGVDAAKEAVSVAEKTFESADTISTAKKALFDAERQLELARTLKYADETTDVFRQAQRVKKYKGLDQAARYVTYGGLIGGGVMMLTAGHVEETFDAVTMKGNVTGLVAKPFEMGWGAIWDDHSSVPPIQKAIMARISRRRVLGKLNHLLEETKEKGGDQMRVWYELGVEKGHPWVIAEARNRGIDLESLKAMFVKEGSAMAEAALGDAGQRVRESIG